MATNMKAGGNRPGRVQKGQCARKDGRRKLTYKVSLEYDDEALRVFLEKQLQLFPETVASTPEEAADFLETCFAVIAKSKKEVRGYFEEVGTDIEGEDLFSAPEVFPIGDGRYLIVEG